MVEFERKQLRIKGQLNRRRVGHKLDSLSRKGSCSGRCCHRILGAVVFVFVFVRVVVVFTK